VRAIALFTVVLAACGGGSSMDGLLEIKNISVSIHRPPQDVYAFITNGENVPYWSSHDANFTTPSRIDFAVDLAAAEQRVRAAGGKIVKPVFSFPGGRRFHFADPSANELAVWSDR
jgi:hypothetical protein